MSPGRVYQAVVHSNKIAVGRLRIKNVFWAYENHSCTFYFFYIVTTVEGCIDKLKRKDLVF